MEKHCQILIVDDVLRNLQITAQIVKEGGYSFCLAQDGPGALKALEKEIPDLILLDIMMPEMDGLEVCRKIKQNELTKEIPIIFLTAKNQAEDLVAGFNAGGVDYITKPFNRAELLVRIKNHLELSAAKLKLLEMNKMRDKLYSIIAHDIRSPFASITAAIEALAEGLIIPQSKEYQEIMEFLEKTTHATGSLLNNLLEWTKYQNDSIPLNFQNNRIYPIIRDCIQLHLASVQSKGITVDVQVREETSAFFDVHTIHAVIRNILSNAIKFTHEKGKITIMAEQRSDSVSISIKDTGVGIPAEVLKKIMDNDMHHTSLGTKKEQGSGLGLYLIKDFLKQNKGQLKIESTEGVGTTITILIPIAVSS